MMDNDYIKINLYELLQFKTGQLEALRLMNKELRQTADSRRPRPVPAEQYIDGHWREIPARQLPPPAEPATTAIVPVTTNRTPVR